MNIHNVKAIDDFSIDFPLDKGLYAITGENASGKSTIVTCASTAFFNMSMKLYFGRPQGEAYIEFILGDQHRKWECHDGWWEEPNEKLNLKGFYEGSIIYGNRFRDTNFSSIKKLESVSQYDLEPADEFVRQNLGKILLDNTEYYSHLSLIMMDKLPRYKFNGQPYFYEKDGVKISQVHMSTGESMLVNILHSLNMRAKTRFDLNQPCVMFLDEVELALHPSSLRRLVDFLKEFADTYNMAIFFSTHSLELIREIRPSNIYYLERHTDNSIELINPCYPAYATRSLYCSFDYDRVILVEDDLAKRIVDKLLREYRLLGNKLVFVMPCGGWQNVLKMGYEIAVSNLIPGHAKILVILDGDIEKDVQSYITAHKLAYNIPLNYLPIESLEKYLKKNLYDSLNPTLFRQLTDYVFRRNSLDYLVKEYKKGEQYPKNDKDGKILFSILDKELRETHTDRDELVEMVVKYILENDKTRIEKLATFLKKQVDPQ